MYMTVEACVGLGMNDRGVSEPERLLTINNTKTQSLQFKDTLVKCYVVVNSYTLKQNSGRTKLLLKFDCSPSALQYQTCPSKTFPLAKA